MLKRIFGVGSSIARWSFSIIALIFLGVVAQAQTLSLEPVITSGLSSPVAITNAGDGSNRLFIIEQSGRIRIFQNGALLATPFLTVPNTVLVSGGEQGLLGLAFHPQFARNRRFFIYYTRQPDGAVTVAEYRASATDPNLAETTGTPLLSVTKRFTNHNGGTIAFGPDGFLYIGTGDGGGSGDPDNNAQNINSLLGKMLRIDVDRASPGLAYGIPADNPFAGATPGADEIYAVGLRNPYRFSFDKRGTALMVGDVGQGAREEVDIVTRGGNYGWRITEGNLCFNPSTNCDRTGLTAPIHDYGRDLGCSVIGGYVYRGTRNPALVGTYIFGDFCSGRIFTYLNGNVTEPLNVGTTFSFSGFGEDEAGEIYLVFLNGNVMRLGTTCSHAASPTSANIAAEGGSGSVAVTSNVACGWQAVSNVPWITVQSGSSGTGNGTVQYQVATNPGPARKGTISVAGNLFVVSQAARNGATPGQFRPTNGFVYLRNTNDTGIADNQFFYGTANDVPLAGDWNGDGVDTIGIYRNGTFFLRNSNSSGFADLQFPFGAAGDIPLVGDWDGDGVDTVGIARGTQIFLRNSNTAGNAEIQFFYGTAGDTYITGDWDGDGKDTIGAFRPSTGFVYLRNSNSDGFADTQFFYGIAGDRPVAGDWNGDGVDTIGIVRGNQWFLRNSNSSGFAEIQFSYGTDTDVPIAGDWNGLP